MKDIIIDNSVWVSFRYFIDNGICSQNTVKSFNRSINSRIRKIHTYTYIDYDSIPITTRAKLPSKDILRAFAKNKEYDERTEQFFIRLEKAYLKGFMPYRQIYKDLGMNEEKMIEYAQHHAVWVEVLKIHGEKSRQGLRNLWEAYCRLYPDRYVYNRMNACINICKMEGIQRLLVRKQSTTSRKVYNSLYDKWVMDALSSGKRYSQAAIHRLICEVAKEYEYKEPSLTTVKNRCRQLLPFVSASRNGQDRDVSSKLPYASMERATVSNMQWQIDGWRLPFYMEGFKTLTLFFVLDACSGKVVGYEIAPSESTETILSGLEDAVEKTGVLPLEIVSDNHSFNKTSEAEHFKDELNKKAGIVWTISSDPRRKSFVERSFKTFGEKFCKLEQGYVGEGIRTRNRNGRTTQELLDQYTKAGHWLDAEHIELIAIKCIEAYNKDKGNDGKNRNERYEASRNVNNENAVSLIDRMRLFTRTAKYKVTRGQINITRENVKYEFQLRASLFNLWNNKEVNVRYVNFDEIYLFEIGTDKYIGTVARKQLIHSALADQTDEDKEKLFKHKGRLAGIKNARKQSQIKVSKDAFLIDPNAAYAMNAKLTPKDIVEEFKENGQLRAIAERRGLNLDLIPKMPCTPEVKTYSHEEANKNVNKRRESPLLATEKEIREFDINKYLNEDE